MKKKQMSKIKANEILLLLEEPTEDRRSLKQNLQKEASVKELIIALHNCRVDLTCRILCDILAARKAKSAVNVILECLENPSQEVKDDAAEALGKIGDKKAGPSLLEHFIEDPCLWYAVALGAIGYTTAIPYLINALHSQYSGVRGGSAWSLGFLKATDAKDSLKQALYIESDDYAKNRMLDALKCINELEA